MRPVLLLLALGLCGCSFHASRVNSTTAFINGNRREEASVSARLKVDGDAITEVGRAILAIMAF